MVKRGLAMVFLSLLVTSADPEYPPWWFTEVETAAKPTPTAFGNSPVAHST